MKYFRMKRGTYNSSFQKKTGLGLTQTWRPPLDKERQIEKDT